MVITMGITELILISIGLAMDAFAVSVCKGLKMRKLNYKQGCIIAGFFGVFQALMPLIGWAVGINFARYIDGIDHWVAFVLLTFIGIKMILESLKGEEKEGEDFDMLDIRELIILSLATSIDALAVGITLALMPDIHIVTSVLIIGVITFGISFVGVVIGNKFGAKYQSKAEIVGGVILVLIGVKIVLEQYGYINF